MTRNFRIMLLLVAAAAIGFGLAGLGAQRLQAQAKPPAEDTTVGVVNVNTLIAKSAKNTAYQAEIQKRAAQLKLEAEQKQKKINLLRSDLDVIANAEARAKKEREIIKAIAELQAWNQIQQTYLQRDQQTFLVEIYGEIDKTVAKVAQREGYDMVVMDVATPDFGKLSPEQLLQFMGGRQVIYRSEKVDLTQVVLAQMDLDFQGRAN